MEQKNRQLLCHDGGKLLIWLVKRLSIPREVWNHTYCFTGQKKQLPTKKKDRVEFLDSHMRKLKEVIRVNSPCVVVGSGKITCECLTGSSVLKRRAGTRWKTNLTFSRAGVKKVWIMHNTDAALYDPDLIVSMTRVLWKAATEAGIPTQIDYDLKMFDFSNYQ
jgi:hypothetical protein